MDRTDVYEMFEKLADVLGYEQLANELFNYFSSWDMEDALNSITTNYDVELED